MRNILVILLCICGCGASLPDVKEASDKVAETVARADDGVADLERIMGFAKAGLAPARVAAASLCEEYQASCQEMADALSVAEKAIDTAELAVADYKAGRAAVDETQALVQAALNAVDAYIDVVRRVHQSIG